MHGDDDNNDANDLLESQIQENNQNIEQERQALRERQIEILKMQGQPSWTPTNTPAQMKARGNQDDSLFTKVATDLVKGGFGGAGK